MERWSGMGWLQMPEVTYGGENGKKVQLVEDPDLVAVRARRGRSLREGPVTPPEAALLDDMESVLSFPQVGVEVYRRSDEAPRSMEEMRQELHESPATRFAGRVLVDETTREPVLYTENLFVKFFDDENRDGCLETLREAGLTVKQELPYATNAFFVAAPEGSGQKVFDIANELLRRKEVEYCNPELVRRLNQRAIFPQQWHLKTTTVDGQLVSASANVEAAHAITEGAGVTIAIIDTGTDMDHDEFSTPGKLVAPQDTSANDADPRPGGRDENHGTACAGVACGDGKFGASGVAPQARLMPIRMISQLGSQAEANAFYWAAENGADVISCSWGPADGRWWDPNDPLHDAEVSLPDSTRLALDYAVTRGRDGKGCVVLFAAGNGNESVDNDGYASYERVLAVAACNDRSLRSGYSDDDYTNSFGGTSSACPGAAGVAALVLSCNPSLTTDQVRDVLRRTCEQIDPQGGEYDEQGHSPLYGYGRLNAESAVRSVGGQTRRVHGRRVHGRRVHGRRVHGRSTVGGEDVDPMVGAPEDAREVLDLAMNGGGGGQTTSELVLGLLLA